MPIYMDRHDIQGVTAKAVAEAHEKDMAVQDKHGAKYLTYWVDESRGHIFCLCDAPSKDIAIQVHSEAHGLVPNHIIEVEKTMVEAFLGNVTEPPPLIAFSQIPLAKETLPGNNSAFRIILFTDIKDSTALTRQLGDTKAMEVLRMHNTIIRNTLKAHDGREVKHTGDGFMISFESVSQAVECAISILRGFEIHNKQNPDIPLHLRLGLSAGEPIEEDKDLFGSAVQLAARLCKHASTDAILVSDTVRELYKDKSVPFTDKGEEDFKGFDRPVRVYEVDWK